MKRFILLISVILTSLSLTSCGVSKLDDIEVNSFRIAGISPRSFRSVDVVLAADIDNPAMDIIVDSISGSIFHADREIGTFNADPFVIPGRKSSECTVNVCVSLSRNVSVMDAINCVSNFNIEEYTVDAETEVKLGKAAKVRKIQIDNQPLESIIRRFE